MALALGGVVKGMHGWPKRSMTATAAEICPDVCPSLGVKVYWFYGGGGVEGKALQGMEWYRDMTSRAIAHTPLWA